MSFLGTELMFFLKVFKLKLDLIFLLYLNVIPVYLVVISCGASVVWLICLILPIVDKIRHVNDINHCLRVFVSLYSFSISSLFQNDFLFFCVSIFRYLYAWNCCHVSICNVSSSSSIDYIYLV